LLLQGAKQVPSGNYALFGQESNGSTWALCRMNMFLHSTDSARIEWGDTLNSPMLVEKDKLMKFNVVVANPPFSLDKWGAENAESDPYKRFFRGIPPKSKGDWAFITHMVETCLAGEGRVVVVVPHGVLFRGSSEGKIREAMIRENLLDAVIGLPENLFPTTSIPVAILVFDRSREIGGKNAKRDAEIAARRTDFDRKDGVVLFDGAVRVADSEYSLGADMLYAFLDGTNSLKRIVADGSVAVTNGTRFGCCPRAAYVKSLGRVTMYGEPGKPAKLADGGRRHSEVEGRKISFWLDSEQVEVEGSMLTVDGLSGGMDDFIGQAVK
jgi:hypothetical protein